ncbi:MAG TPA: hypothetical protein VFU69_11730 [Ktedonobacterales bacterium]|nr:hypothetical protein [Ktedonobacterales bacterium]
MLTMYNHLRQHLAGLLLLGLLLSACASNQASSNPTPTATRIPTATATPPPTATPFPTAIPPTATPVPPQTASVTPDAFHLADCERLYEGTSHESFFCSYLHISYDSQGTGLNATWDGEIVMTDSPLGKQPVLGAFYDEQNNFLDGGGTLYAPSDGIRVKVALEARSCDYHYPLTVEITLSADNGWKMEKTISLICP